MNANRRRLSAARNILGVFTTCGLLTTGAQAAEFIPLGNLSGGDIESIAYDVSDDGSVVVGRGESSDGLEAFRWTAETGMVGLGDFPGGSHNSQAFGVSDDGSTVVGYGNRDDSIDGTLTIEFADCSEGLVNYQITSLDISGEIPIQRITPDNVALCEAL